MYVLQRTTDGAFVARPGARGSYTGHLQHARVFDSKEAAEKERCVENERVVSVEAMMRR